MKQFIYILTKAYKYDFSHYLKSIDKYSQISPFTCIYGLARAFLAFSLLITLLFNSIDNLYVDFLFERLKDSIGAFSKYNFFLLFDYNQLWIAKIIAILVLILVIIGYYPQITAILHWWISYSFFNSASIIEGGDQICSILTLLIIPIALLDTRINHWHKIKVSSAFRNLTAWVFFILIEIQGAILYLQAGIEKPYKVEEWRDGSAIYYWFSHNLFGANDFMFKLLTPLLSNHLLVFIINWSVIIFELILFGAFFLNPKRRIVLFVGAVIFHFLIILIHGLTSFFFAITGLLIIYLLNKYFAFHFYYYNKKLYKTITKNQK